MPSQYIWILPVNRVRILHIFMAVISLKLKFEELFKLLLSKALWKMIRLLYLNSFIVWFLQHKSMLVNLVASSMLAIVSEIDLHLRLLFKKLKNLTNCTIKHGSSIRYSIVLLLIILSTIASANNTSKCGNYF